ncbi:hypothetical protein RSOL_035340 [Rhizoctonia solani AG-3 Rhs1AP]|uniref:Uncharacterized protein n=2 Tax=Rhizoctonia solani AG-3 TaxID=1086053 RepID=A0A074RT99_9AGAM|nr:hypothetical protein RSOL_035340 [Rhizoctonia solani AG-3 Rhs1AP]KEP47893.1 hypothetical protein V565_140250 [Rhizoctonia solani 123E]
MFSAALPRPRVEEHIDVMQEGQANLHERVVQLEKKVEYYKNLSEEHLNDVVQWVGGNAPRPPWALQPASSSATKMIKSEDVKPKGGDLELTEPKRPRKKKGDNPTVKSLDEVDLANDLSTHVRTRLYKWMGVTDSMAVNKPQFNPDGTPKFWVMDDRGVEQLRPHWGSNLGLNLEGPGAWVRDFITSCMDPGKMPAGMGNRFKSLVADDYLKTLNAGVFASMSSNWKKKSNGELERKSALKNIKARRNSRHKKKHEMRQERRTGTILAAPEWDPAFQLRCTSPELSDAENKSEAFVIEEQAWLDPLVRQAHQALDQKAFTQSGVKIKALSRRAVMFEGSIPLTKKDKPIPRWMVSDSYALKHPQFLAAASELIDFTQTNRPNIDELTTVFKATPRTYIPACPRTVGDEALLNLSVAEASDAGLPGSRQDTPASAVFEPQPRPSEPPTPVEPPMPVCADNEPLVVPTPHDEPPTSSTSYVPHGNTQSGYVPGSSTFTTPFAPTLPADPPPQIPHPSSYTLGRYGGAYIRSPQTATFGHPSSHGQPVFILHNGQYLQVVQPNQQLSGDTITGASYPTAHHGPMHPDEGLGFQARTTDVVQPPIQTPGPSHITFNPSHQNLPPTPQHSYPVSSLTGSSGELQMGFNSRSQGGIIVDPNLGAGTTQEPHPASSNEMYKGKGKEEVYSEYCDNYNLRVEHLPTLHQNHLQSTRLMVFG